MSCLCHHNKRSTHHQGMMAASSGQGGVQPNSTATKSEQIITQTTDTNDSLDRLFEVVKNSVAQQQSTFRQKKLPPSFFKCPNIDGRSSRENLLLSGGGGQESGNATFSGQPTHPGLVPQHIRSRSSPAQLPNSLSLQQQAPPPNHRPQHSMDLDYVSNDAIGMNNQGWNNDRNRYMLR